MIITFGPWIAARRRLEVGAVARRPVADERPAQDVDVVVGDLAAAVEALVDDDRVLVRLREEVALEVGVARAGGVGHVDVGDAPAGGLVDLAQVALDPVAVAQRQLARDRHDLHRARAGAVGVRADGRSRRSCPTVFSNSAVQVRSSACRSWPLTASRYSPALHVHARLGQRRAQLRGPVQAAVDLLEAVAAVLDLVVGAEQAARARSSARGGTSPPATWLWPTASSLGIHWMTRFRSPRVRQVGQERARTSSRIAFQSTPCMSGVVEVVAVDAPGLVEDLRPLGARIDLHLDRVGRRSCRRRRLISLRSSAR